MSPDELRKAARAHPFKPVTIYRADGRRLRVTHPDFIAMSSTGRTATVYDRGEDGADQVDVFLITRLAFARGSQKPRLAR